MEIIGFLIAVIFFALMRQARAWELNLPLPSLLAAVESNLRMPLSFLLLAVVPLFVSLVISLLTTQPFPPFASFIIVSIICYSFANGSVIILILCSQLVFYVAATVQVFIKLRWQAWEERFRFLRQFINLFSIFTSFKVVCILRGNPILLIALVTVSLVCFVHPALGLIALVLFHALSCHSALCSHVQRKESYDYQPRGDLSQRSRHKSGEAINQCLPLDENNSNDVDSAKSFGETQLEIFNYRHGVLILHLLASLMFVPSLVAWLQRIGMGQSFPWFADLALCVGVILHGLCTQKPGTDALSFSFPGVRGREAGLSLIYLLAGYYCYLSALALAPYRSFYAMAAVGAVSFISRVIERRNREKGDAYFSASGRKHSHKH